MNNTGYKRQRAEFQDLLYENVSRVGTQTSAQGNILPVGIDLGGGVKTVGTPGLITQGSLSQTGNTLDMAIIGDGFFKVLIPDGSFSYTRDGSLTPASGAPQDGISSVDGVGTIQQGSLEQANVDAVTEISNLIAAQRAYEMNSKVITAADEMLKTTANVQ
jgi:flagellar basal body rod protein FlgG